MPTPEGLNTTTLHGLFVEPDATGTPLQGTLSFTPNPAFILFPVENVIVAGTETVTLDEFGEFTIDLVSNDNAGSNPGPNDWLYTVSERIIGQRPRTYNISLPHNGGVTLELSDIQPTEAAPTYIPVVGPQGAPGIVTEVNGYSQAIITLTAADVNAVPSSLVGAANGVASLDASSLVPVAQIPSLSATYVPWANVEAPNGVAALDAGGKIKPTELDLATAAPGAIATAGAVGVATKLAREDHTHSGMALTGAQLASGAKNFTTSLQTAQLGVGVAPGTTRVRVVSTIDEIGLQVEQITVTGSNPLLGTISFDTDGTGFAAKVNGDTVNRIALKASGNIELGPGTGARDVILSRPSTAQLRLTPAANASNSSSTGGALNITNSGSTGAGLVVYSTQAAPTGHLIVVRANNATFNQAALYAEYVGTTHAISINHQGTGGASSGLNVASANTAHSAVGISGVETGKGTLKITHTGTGSDANAAALSLDLAGAGTAAQGIFLDSSGVTTGNLLVIRNNAVNLFNITSTGTVLFGADVNLYRSAANVLKTDDAFAVVGELQPANLVRATRATATDSQFETRVVADTNARWFIRADGQMWWGPGNAAGDTNLYRSAANTLSTDDVFGAFIENQTTGGTPAANFSVTSYVARKTCGIADVSVILSYSGSTITADAAGNIGDTLCFTLPSGWAPTATHIVTYDKSGTANGAVVIASDGTCTLKSLSGTATIASSASVSFSLSGYIPAP